ncbi:MAG: PAS domain S-box protein [Anaerolineales bacterium]|nr:PAS domain S-box protein [Anaerolineales bacterium]
MKNRKPPPRNRPSPARKKPAAGAAASRKPKTSPPEDLSPFFDSPLDLLCIGDRRAIFQKLNPQWEAVLGFPPEEMEGRDFIEFIHPDDRAAALEAFGEIERRKNVQTLTNRVRSKNGAYRWLEWKYVLRGEHIYAAARDITDHQQAEAALLESRRMLETILDTIPVRVFWKDLHSVFLGCNRPFVLDAGFSSPAEIIGRDDHQMGWAQQADLYRSDDRIVMETGKEKIGYEEPQTRPDGKQIWLRTSKKPLRDLEGNIRGVLGTYEDITEQKTAEKALRESDERYQRISRTITDYIYHVRVENGKAVKTLHSRRCLAVTGYTVEEFESDPDLWLRMVDPRDRPMVEEQARTVLSGRDTPVIEHRLRRKDGIRRWVRNTPVLYCDPGGRLVGYDGLIQDITERKEAELQLHTQHELALALSATFNMKEGLRVCLETAMRASGMEAGGVYLADPGTGAMDLVVEQGLPPDLANLVRHLEPDRPEARWMMEGKPIYTDFNNLQSHMPLIPQAYEGLHALIGLPIRCENRIIGCLNLVSSTVDAIPPAIRETLETIVAQIGSAIGRLRSEAELRESQLMLQTVLDTIPVRVFWKDRSSRYLGCNQPFARDAGFSSPAETLGKDDFQMGWVEQAERYRSDDMAVIETGREKLGYEEPQTWADGKRIWVRTSKVPLRDSDGWIRGVLGTYEDITQSKQAEEEIRNLNAELEHRVAQRTAQLEAANKEMEAFAYSVSHDLRAPLRAIDGFTRVLEEDYGHALDAEGKRVCGVIRRNTLNMDKLIDGLLALSRLSRAEMEYQAADMDAMVQSVFQELVPPESRARIDFRTGRLPTVHCDPVLLRQVWINLISNAVKFSNNREPASIRVECRSTPEEDVFSIHDNGAGFDMHYADRVFAVFQRLHNASDFEGTGVGLAIVQRVIHRHGGRVWAEGEVDKGTTIRFSLPKP